jgi:hypothetical protein
MAAEQPAARRSPRQFSGVFGDDLLGLLGMTEWLVICAYRPHGVFTYFVWFVA